MPKFEVIRPWAGVKKGQIVTLDEVHPALAANVRMVGHASAGEITADVSAKVSEEAERALAEAKRQVERLITDARAEAGDIVDAARTEADDILSDARAEADKIRAAAGNGGTLTPATTGGAEVSDKDRKALITARLKELNISFDGRKSADELGALLPGDELAEVLAGK